MKLLLFLYCSTIRAQSSQVHVLWEDHRNDIFVNGFGMALLSHLRYRTDESVPRSPHVRRAFIGLDPMGGILVRSSLCALRTLTKHQPDRPRCHARLGTHHLHRVRAARRQVCAPRLYPACRLLTERTGEFSPRLGVRLRADTGTAGLLRRD